MTSPNIFGTVCYRKKEITLNLIWQSNATPTVSAYAHLSGPFDYNKLPLAPMGCEAQIEGHGCTIQLTSGISSPTQNIIAHTRVMSRPPKANAIQTQSISNTKT